MKTFRVKEMMQDDPVKALDKALSEACSLSASSINRHVIIENIVPDGRQWQAIITVLYEPSQKSKDMISHMFIRSKDEPVFRPLAKKYKFEYKHVLPEGKFWDAVLKHHPDIELYKATHGEDDEEEGSASSGGFVRPVLEDKPKQAFSGKIGKGPSI